MRLKVIIAIIIVAAIGVGAWAAFGRGNGYSYSTPSSATTKTPSAPAQSAAGPVVQTKTASSVGQYLADANGNALYTYDADTVGVSNCMGSCLYNWPVYSAADSSATLPTNVTVISRSDGTKQYAYKGLPLYTFTSDSPGQATGDGVENFHIAKP